MGSAKVMPQQVNLVPIYSCSWLWHPVTESDYTGLKISSSKQGTIYSFKSK